MTTKRIHTWQRKQSLHVCVFVAAERECSRRETGLEFAISPSSRYHVPKHTWLTTSPTLPDQSYILGNSSQHCPPCAKLSCTPCPRLPAALLRTTPNIATASHQPVTVMAKGSKLNKDNMSLLEHHFCKYAE